MPRCVAALRENRQRTNVGLNPGAARLVPLKHACAVVASNQTRVAEHRVKCEELLERIARIKLAVTSHDSYPCLGERGVKTLRRPMARRELAEESVDRRRGDRRRQAPEQGPGELQMLAVTEALTPAQDSSELRVRVLHVSKRTPVRRLPRVGRYAGAAAASGARVTALSSESTS